MARILLVEDERVIRAEIERILKRDGHELVAVASVAAAEQERPECFDLVITDVRLAGETGDVLLERVGQTPVIMMTAYGSVSAAVDAMKRGAADYLSKPFEPRELSAAVERVLRHRTAISSSDESAPGEPYDIVATEASPMQETLRWARKVAPTEASVLILGESGTGKELIARAVHNQSARTGAFVPVNCASIPETLLESELFGHEKGAFTGAMSRQEGLVHAADGGTLFLDEIGELSQAAQARLLRILQQHEVRRVGARRAESVDIRLVAATHRNLPMLVEQGDFRADLYFRLKVVEIAIPPLRQRRDDIPALADVFLARATARLGRQPAELDRHAVAAMRAYKWPGNVRELQHAIERAVILHEFGPITAELLGLPTSRPCDPIEGQINVDDASLEGYLKRFVLSHQGELSETELAKRLGISRKTLWERRQRMGIPRRESRPPEQ
ncbi:MAG: sigma-54-dependent Fis family transcriptional regulator [Myxococcales bacterium]|nr:sigma-54 dependent transcriptional regulator [Deltaproteobacteria bacterium]NND28259.1 sigma-54-dependent Fis family transcriptional regulator [Myxococcales bacterium]NNK07478.1 sigma-54-dependent Fis family transcriptional regulator [Myxococcales bacterium]NNK44380.1 sigma-54-dependent Fis family transcriptional regulator [Myxococcales bacterium]